jgi:hypothetical protein
LRRLRKIRPRRPRPWPDVRDSCLGVNNAAEEREKLRTSFLPREMRVLFVGESPPAGGTFFYKGDSILFDATRNAFLQVYDEPVIEGFLSRFKDFGCYLEDLSAVAINRLPESQKRQFRREGEEGLAQKIRVWSPRAVVITMLGIEDNVRAALRVAGLSDRPVRALPFPRKDFGRYEQYVDGLASAIRGFRPVRKESFHRTYESPPMFRPQTSAARARLHLTIRNPKPGSTTH